MKPIEYSQMIGHMTRDKTSREPRPMVQETLTMDQEPLTMAQGGRIPFAEAPGSVKTKVIDAIGRAYDPDNMGRPAKLEGKVGRIVEYLQDLPEGSSFYKPDLARELDLGLAKDGSQDTSLLTKAINSRDELKNKSFKFLTKTDMTVKKINDFVEIFVEENGRAPTQGEIQKGAKADPTRIRTYIEEGKIENVADTVYDRNTKSANYILDTKNPTVKGLEKIVGIGNAEKALTRVYINSLDSLKKKFSNIDEGRSVYGNFDNEQIQVLKNKVRRVPGFNNLYEREITDLISNAYPGKGNAAKRKTALKKVAMFKKFNNEVSKKFGLNQVLDHPLSYDFITKASQGVDPSELIRVRPLPDRVNTFKSFLESDLDEISKTLKKGYNPKAFSKYEDMRSIATELGIPFPKMAKTGNIISTAAAKVGDKPLIGDAKQSAKIQNNFRSFVQKVKDDPRMKRLGINLKELTDLAKLPKIDIAKYDKAVTNFISKSGKFGIPLVAGYGAARGADFLKKEGIGFDKEFEPTASLSDAPLVEEGLSTGEKTAIGGGTTAAVGGAYAARKPIMAGLGKAFRTLGTRPAGVGMAGYSIADNLKKGENVVDATLDPIVGLELMLPNLFKENIGKITSNPYIQNALKFGKYGRALTPIGAGITAAGLGIDAYKYGKERKKLLDSLTDEQKTNLFRQEQSDVVKQQLRGDQNTFDEFSAAEGGLANLMKKYYD